MELVARTARLTGMTTTTALAITLGDIDITTDQPTRIEHAGDHIELLIPVQLGVLGVVSIRLPAAAVQAAIDGGGARTVYRE